MLHALIVIMLIHVSLSMVAWALSARIIKLMPRSGLGEELKSNSPMIVFWRVKYADKFEKFLNNNKIDASFMDEIIRCKKKIKVIKTIQSIFFLLMSVVFVLLLR